MRTGGRQRSLLRRLLGGCAIVAVTVGVPAVLAAVGGSPFAVHLTDGIVRLPELVARHAPIRPSDVVAWVVAVCIAVAWLVWVSMCACLVVEARARRRGLPATRLPAARTLQSVAAVLVGSVLALGALSRAGQLDGRATVPGGGGLRGSPPGTVVIPLAGRMRVAPRPWAAATRRVSVSRTGDFEGRPDGPGMPDVPVLDDFSAWFTGSAVPPAGSATQETAGSVVGDGPVGDGPVGGQAGDGGDHPAGQLSRQDDERTPLGGSGRVHVVARRETLWSIADRELGSSLRWPELASLNYGVVQPDGGALGSDHWVRPGWRLRLPGTSGPEPCSPGGVPADRLLADAPGAEGRRTTVAGVSRAVDAMALREGARADAELLGVGQGPRGPAVLELGTAVGLGAGLTALAERLRRAQWRRRQSGRLPRLADGPAVALERQLRTGARIEDVRDVMQVLGLVRTALGAQTRVAKGLGVRAVAVSGSEIAVLVASSGSPEVDGPLLPEPFRALPEPGWWAVPRPALRRSPLAHDGGSGVEVSPLALVTVAVSAASAALVDLLAVGPTYVEGAPEVVDAQLRSFVVELATAPWRSSARVVVVGLDLVPPGLPGVDVAAEAGPVLAELGELAEPASPSSRCGPEERGPGPAPADGPAGCSLPSLLVVCGSRCRRSDVERLVGLSCAVGGGTTVVAAEPWPGRAGPVLVPEEPVRSGDEHGARRARVGDPASFVSPHGFPSAVGGAAASEPVPGEPTWQDTGTADGCAAGLAPAAAEALGALVSAARSDTVGADAKPYRALTMPLPRWYGPATRPAAADEASSPPVAPVEPTGPEVEVLVLGPVEIRGVARPFTRAWARELVVYLAMHERGATTDTWAAALWPDRTLAPSSLHSTASVARRTLGVARDGLDHLPKSQGRLRLRSTVGTDWARFVRLADEDDPDAWAEALDLVRGRPFEGLRAPDWPLLEGIAPAIEASVVDVAGRCSAAALRRGDAGASSWAARRGLRVSPYDERLYRMLMRAADLAGNVAGVDAAMAELLTLVADDVEPCDSVHPATIDLYRQLSRRSRLPKAASGA